MATEDYQVSAEYENKINEIGKPIKLKQICLSFGEKSRVRIDAISLGSLILQVSQRFFGYKSK